MAFTPVTFKDANSTSTSMAAYQDPNGYNITIQSRDSSIAHYRAGVSRMTPPAAPVESLLIAGSGTKTVRVKKIGISGIATAAGQMPFTVHKNSNATTTGATMTALTKVPLDSGNAAATAIVSTVGTANITTPLTSLGNVYVGELELAAATSGVCKPHEITFGDGGQALVLRGVAESVVVDFGGTALPSGTKFDYWVEWAEDAS